MKKFVCLVGLFLFFLNGFAQNTYDFYLQLNPEVNIGEIKSHKKQGGTIKVKTGSREFTKFLKQYSIYQFKPAFPKAKTMKLQQVLLITLGDSKAIKDFLKRKEIRNIVPYNSELKGDYPNDFYDSIGRPNTALQLIKAPQAWTLTHGDTTVVVGVCDRRYETDHEDLKGKITENIKLRNPSHSAHGTGVAGIIAANTNNDRGIASIGYDTKLVVVSGNYQLIDGLDSLSKVPGMKVINCSWGICAPKGARKEKLDSIIKKVQERGVLVVASAGNGYAQPCRLNKEDRYNGYRYPASYDYDNTISVTSVGHKFPIGNKDPKYGRTAWRDCHQNTPDINSNNPKTTHTHNDRVDITAPGWQVKAAREGNTYEIVSGTSVAAPFVTGTAALMFAVNPRLTPAEAKDILKCTADDISHIKYNKQFKGQLGAGRLDAYKAVLIAKLVAGQKK